MPIPEPILNFFGHLFNFNPETYDNAANSVMADNFSDLIGDDIRSCQHTEEVVTTGGDSGVRRSTESRIMWRTLCGTWTVGTWSSCLVH